MTKLELFARSILWYPYGLAIVSFLPQILKNYRLKSAQGISSGTVFINFFAILTFVVYAYLLALPVEILFMVTLQSIMIFSIVLQKYCYSTSASFRAQLRTQYMLLISFMLIGTLYGIFVDRTLVGDIAGWLSLGAIQIARFPQIYKNWVSKTMRGYSLTTLLIGVSAQLVGLFTAVVLKLPIQSIVIPLVTLGYCAIQLTQFYCYRHNK